VGPRDLGEGALGDGDNEPDLLGDLVPELEHPPVTRCPHQLAVQLDIGLDGGHPVAALLGVVEGVEQLEQTGGVGG